MTDKDRDELIAVPLPNNRTTAEFIHAVCRSEGIQCELLTADSSGWEPRLAGLETHRLLIRPADRDRVMRIIAEHAPGP